ncbi:hypothetical protein BGZ70_006134 [Mortierella alpina]|uniref:Uncharacterized protein n=1 Tax=Mortierella alpina TaxID=64518 RepID=A0A9P6J8B6_MORAP|nr:hypothetical protein BGZ70_006134 [Mortierella alpina]
MVATTAAPTVAAAPAPVPAKVQSSSASLDLTKRGSETTLDCWKTCHSKALEKVLPADEYRTTMDYCTKGLNPQASFEALFAERTCFHDLVDGYKKRGDLKAKMAKATEKAAFCIMYHCYRQ